MTNSDTTDLLQELNLKEYEAVALTGLLELGRTTAPNLVEATDIPQARIYTVLESLSDAGYVKIYPSRPKEYEPKPPKDILARAKENRRQEYEQYRQRVDQLSSEFLETFEPLYKQASDDINPTEELFYVVSVGDPSETETEALYREAEDDIIIISKSFEYFPDVMETFEETLDRGVSIRILLLHPRHLKENNTAVQKEIVDKINDYEDVSICFSNERLPLRGTLADPSLDYESGKAIFLVEAPDIPLHMRQAAITENSALVAGMERYADLIWEYDSNTQYPR